MMRTVIALVLLQLVGLGGAKAEDSCNIADVMYGSVEIELVRHKEGYETGIITGADFDSKRFAAGRILGKIESAERDGSQRITDVNQNLCGVVYPGGRIDIKDTDCSGCNKDAKIKLQRVTNESMAVISNGLIMGTVKGRLPK